MEILLNAKKIEIEAIRIVGMNGRTINFTAKRKFVHLRTIAKIDGLNRNIIHKSGIKKELKIFKKIIKETINHPKFFRRNLFSNFIICTQEINESDLPLKILSSNKSKIWVSRKSVLLGIWPSDIEPKLEYDRERDPSQFAILVRDVLSQPNLAKFDPMQRTQLYEFKEKIESPFRSIADAKVIHGKLVLKDEKIVNRDYLQMAPLDSKVNYLCKRESETYSLRTFKELQKIENGIFLGSNSSWYHFLAEYLPKIMLLPEPIRRNYPLILESGVSKNILEAVKIVTGVDPITVANFESLEVLDLKVLTNIEFHRANDSHENLIEMSQLVLEKIGLPKRSPSKKLFLARDRNLFRPLQNQIKVVELLTRLDFSIIEPGKLSFIEQVEKLNEAQIVVAEPGAALTNLIFCQPKTTVVEIQPPSDLPLFWSSFSAAFDLCHHRVVGKRKYFGPKGLSSDGYAICTEELEEVIRRVQINC